MEILFKDLGYGIRSLLKHPGFTAIAVITLALGIGANTAMFSVINAVLLRPLPYRDPARLVTIWEESPERGMYQMPVSLANVRDWVDQNQTFEQISAYTFTNLNLTGTGEPARLGTVRSSANFFPLIGATPVIGRSFLPEEDKEGANHVVILGHALWQSRFGSDPGIVGKWLTLNNQSYTVVGVMASNSQFPVGFGYMGKVLNDPIDLYVPLGASRLRVLRLLLTESLMLSLAGGGIGFLLALWGTDALMALEPDNIPRLNEVGVDARVFLFTIAVSIVTGIVFGLVPGMRAAKPDLNEALKEGSRGSMGSAASKRTLGVLVALEVALSLVLLVGAGLMIKSFIRLQQANLGFNPENVLAVNLTLPESRYPEERQQASFFQEALTRLQSVSGVQSAGATTSLPLTLSVNGSDFRIEGHPEPEAGKELIIN